MKTRTETINLLSAFCVFLEKEGYLDTDWRDEPPYAIDEYLKGKTFLPEGSSKIDVSNISEPDAKKFKDLFGYAPKRAIEFLQSKYNLPPLQ